MTCTLLLASSMDYCSCLKAKQHSDFSQVQGTKTQIGPTRQTIELWELNSELECIENWGDTYMRVFISGVDASHQWADPNWRVWGTAEFRERVGYGWHWWRSELSFVARKQNKCFRARLNLNLNLPQPIPTN